MNTVYILLGSNVNKEENIVKAVSLIGEMCRIRRVSSVYETSPAGMTDQPDFFNMIVNLETKFNAQTFKTEVLAVIENKLGRKRIENVKNAPRTIDADIILFNTDVFDYDSNHHIPDPDLLKYLHIVIPMAELDPELKHPETGESMEAIRTRLADKNILENDSKNAVVKRPDVKVQNFID